MAEMSENVIYTMWHAFQNLKRFRLLSPVKENQQILTWEKLHTKFFFLLELLKKKKIPPFSFKVTIHKHDINEFLDYLF